MEFGADGNQMIIVEEHAVTDGFFIGPFVECPMPWLSSCLQSVGLSLAIVVVKITVQM